MNELIKLEEYIREKDIPYKRTFISSNIERDNWNQIIVWKDANHNKLLFDVVWHKGSLGFEDGLLELLDVDSDDVEGYLTADDVIRRYFENEEV